MIPEEAIEAAADAMAPVVKKLEALILARAALNAAAPYMQDREQIQIEALTHARAVITQWLSTAEKWRYDQVCSDFQEMIDAAAAGELVRPPARRCRQ